MKFFIFIAGMLVSLDVFANEVTLDRNSYGALTITRDVSLFEEDGGATLIDHEGVFCSINRADIDAPPGKHVVKKGTAIIFGEYQIQGDHSSGISVSWKSLNVPEISELSCWLENPREDLQLIDILAEIVAHPY